MLTQIQENTGTRAWQEVDEIPFNAETAFTNHKGVYKRKIEKRQLKLLEKLWFLKPFLHEDEQVLLATTGCSPVGILEQMLTGWLVFYLKQSLFVFTNKRIFHIPTKSKYTYRRSISQILYADCQSLQLRGGTLKAKYWNGKTEKFINLGWAEQKRIKALLKEMPPEGYQSNAKGRVHLCPDCAAELVQGRFTCPQCGLRFKSKQEARSISIIYPGGGYFYTGHWWLGISDAFVETLLAALLVTSVFAAFRGEPEGMFNVAWFAIVLAIEKAITIYHSNHFVKEYIPKSG